jgi:hypothetical protein
MLVVPETVTRAVAKEKLVRNGLTDKETKIHCY